MRDAGEDDLVAAEAPAGVVVAVAVGQQAKPRRGAHLEQRQRLWQLGKRAEQRCAAARLVGLGTTRPQHRRDLVVV
jgi:hypothetical protein